jgi:hypothetical protein
MPILKRVQPKNQSARGLFLIYSLDFVIPSHVSHDFKISRFSGIDLLKKNRYLRLSYDIDHSNKPYLKVGSNILNYENSNKFLNFN